MGRELEWQSKKKTMWVQSVKDDFLSPSLYSPWLNASFGDKTLPEHWELSKGGKWWVALCHSTCAHDCRDQQKGEEQPLLGVWLE